MFFVCLLNFIYEPFENFQLKPMKAKKKRKKGTGKSNLFDGISSGDTLLFFVNIFGFFINNLKILILLYDYHL